ncbi:MAG TPA: hypothetical protein VGR20_09100 [Acidimicrobiia bacterium]|nr:hypothetical protein [Acidimicrobiia bacterium]
MSHRLRLGLAGVVALVLMTAGLSPGQALYDAHPQVVSADPVDTSPHVVDGKVTAILPMGNRIYVAGSFTQVRNADDSRIIARKGLFALDPATNRVDEAFVADFDVSPDPTADRAVEALAPAPDHNSLFVGGGFGTVNGLAGRKLVKVNAANGQPEAGFDVAVNAAVKSLVANGSRLYLAGPFATVGGQPRAGLAAVDVATGALDGAVDIAFTAPRQGSTPRVETIAVTPDGTTLVAGGNFTAVAGQTRWQVALVDVGSRPAKLIDWQTTRFNDTDQGQLRCASAFDSHPRDVDVSPDGTYFVVVTTGAYTSRGSLCDTASRWEIAARGADLQPTWVDYDGGDSFTAVAITGAAVYVGGHMRWMNNPLPQGSDIEGVPGPGALKREGLAALDPRSGLPLPWNPGRERGEGAWALTSTPDGLWVGSDTDKLGGWTADGCGTCEVHQKLAFLPLAGGAPAPALEAAALPGDLYSVGPGGLVKRSFDGAVLGPAAVLGASVDGNRIRGAFVVGQRLYEGRDDGRLLMWTLDGATFGSPVTVDLRGLPAAHQTRNAVVAGFPVATVTGMFFDGGRLYYTLEGDKKLYYRFFLAGSSPADDVLGTQVLVASGERDGLDWSRVRGMTAAGGHIYWSEGADLHRIDFAGGTPKPGTATVAVAGANLDARGLFLLPSTSGLGQATGPLGPTTPPGAGSVSPLTAGPPGTAGAGYWMVGADGRVATFGRAAHLGDAVANLVKGSDAADIEPTPSRGGYWIVDTAGRVFTFGDARYFGGVDTRRLAKGETVTSLSSTRSGAGYWIFTTRGRVLPFGDARSYGDMSAVALNGPVLDSIPTPSGLGYYMVASDGGIFSFGDARFSGSMGGIRLNAPVQSLVPDPDRSGYWLVASDGGVFAFDAPFRGSMGKVRLNKPVTGMVPFGNGYLMVGEDGGIFNFSDRAFLGSLGDHPPARPIVAVAGF